MNTSNFVSFAQSILYCCHSDPWRLRPKGIYPPLLYGPGHDASVTNPPASGCPHNMPDRGHSGLSHLSYWCQRPCHTQTALSCPWKEQRRAAKKSRIMHYEFIIGKVKRHDWMYSFSPLPGVGWLTNTYEEPPLGRGTWAAGQAQTHGCWWCMHGGAATVPLWIHTPGTGTSASCKNADE